MTQIDVIPSCLVHDGEIHTFFIIFNIFDIHLTESLDAEPTDMEIRF